MFYVYAPRLFVCLFWQRKVIAFFVGDSLWGKSLLLNPHEISYTVPSGHFEVETVYELSTAESDQAVTQLNVTEKLTYDYRVLSLVGPIVEQFAIQYKLETDISYFKQLAEKSIKPSPESSGSH